MITKMQRSKALSFVLVLAMVFTMFAGFTVTSEAYTPTDTMTALYASGVPATSGTYYSISDATEMGYFSTYVNSGKNTAGVTFYLDDDITLSGVWTPVGGHCGVTGTVPNGVGFSGVFDGQGKSVSGLSVSAITTSSANNTGYGLFGYVNGGVVGNLTVDGEVAVTGVAGQDVGGVVGYTNYSLYNITSNVTVSAVNCSNVGGVAGAVENLTTTNVNVKYCANNNPVTGMGRVGGILGASYEGTANHIYIDRCYNLGDVKSTQTSKTYAGGIVGYCCGAITNCYNMGDLTAGGGSVKCYIAGIAGILVHYSTQPSSMANCYSKATFSGYWEPYARYLYASADNSTAVAITNSYWVNTNLIGTQTPFGTEVNVSAKTTSQLTAALLGGAYKNPPPATLDFGGAYTALTSGTPATPPAIVSETGIFLDGTLGSGGDGSSGNPYGSISDALNALSTTSAVIYVVGQVSIGNDTTISSAVPGAAIMRSASYSGDLFLVTGGTTTVSGIIVDGNKDNVSNASGALFRVNGGTLNIGATATLRNNSTQTNGGAIHVQSGSGSLSGAITGNSAQNGGGVYLSGGSFTVNSGGTISGNSAYRNGAGVYVSTGTTFINNGTVSDAIYNE